MYLKILEHKEKQFSFNIKSVIAFSSVNKPIKPEFILQALNPIDYSDPTKECEYQHDQAKNEFGLDCTSTITSDPIKTAYIVDDNNRFRIIRYSGIAYVVNNDGDTVNKF